MGCCSKAPRGVRGTAPVGIGRAADRTCPVAKTAARDRIVPAAPTPGIRVWAVSEPSAVAERLAAARDRVRGAADESGRDPSSVRILLATKTQPASVIRDAIAAGGTLIGENRVQEVLAKADDLAGIAHETHFIGHLQSNKVNQLLPFIHCLQTVDSSPLVARLQARLDALDKQLDVLVQVNVSGEPTKAGVHPSQVRDLVAAVADAPRLVLRGFMTIGLNSPDRAAVRRGYRELAGIRDQALADGWPGAQVATELSMGMSGDYQDAIAEGATIVRLGSAVFGPRPPAARA
jgi:pyridoxal phosphate enzyme (YggS family)